MTTADVDKAISSWLELFTFLRDERGVFALWRELAAGHDVKGKAAHDTRLVAAMNRHGVEHLLTFNASDFRRYEGIVLLDSQAMTTS